MSTTTVFTNNRSQAVRLPLGARFPDAVKKVEVRVRGAERIISPAGQTWDSFFLDGGTVTDDFLPVRADQAQNAREAF
jgi:antitoxin VapB